MSTYIYSFIWYLWVVYETLPDLQDINLRFELLWSQCNLYPDYFHNCRFHPEYRPHQNLYHMHPLFHQNLHQFGQDLEQGNNCLQNHRHHHCLCQNHRNHQFLKWENLEWWTLLISKDSFVKYVCGSLTPLRPLELSN